MRLAALPLFIFAFTMNVVAQPLNVTTVRKGSDFRFPILSSSSNFSSVSRINHLLQLSELYALAKPPYSSIFDQVQINDGSIYGGKTSVVAAVYSNNGGIFSTGVSSTACGATCTWWTRYYTFNIANGDRIELTDLFSKKGYDSFIKLATEKQSQKYRREVKKKVDLEDQEFWLDTLGCFERNRLPDFFIENSYLIIDGENCLTKGQKVAGLDMLVTFKLPMIRKFLNQYGKAVFESRFQKLKAFRSTHLPQLFEGKVDNKYPIAMVLNYDHEDSLWGMYAYLKYGKGLSLRGGDKNNEIKLIEYTLSPDVIDNELGVRITEVLDADNEN